MTRLVLMSCAALAAAAAFAAQAAPQSSPQQCFQTREMRNHTVGDDHTLYLGVGGHDVYRVTTSDNCLAGATSSDPIVLDNTASQGRICGKMDLDIRVRGMRCIVSGVTKLSPEQASALPKHVQP
jgi:hypothetical protein